MDVPQFLSTLSLRRATAIVLRIAKQGRDFYPRSPCGERPAFDVLAFSALLISIHALLAESDLAGPSGPAFLYNFYPRSPCGERHPKISIKLTFKINFYPRSPCGERPVCLKLLAMLILISIHALLAESDNILRVVSVQVGGISIHALLAESDSKPKDLKSRRMVFLSTLSLRRATVHALKLANFVLFLSTLSLRRAT